jgi:hypothetical protein
MPIDAGIGVNRGLRRLDTDNDSVFMNETVRDYCKQAGIEFTRCRPYRKNDQAWVEQKRFEGLEAAAALARLYAAMRLFVNFFQPSFKLAAKTRDGALVRKRYRPGATLPPSQSGPYCPPGCVDSGFAADHCREGLAGLARRRWPAAARSNDADRHRQARPPGHWYGSQPRECRAATRSPALDRTQAGAAVSISVRIVSIPLRNRSVTFIGEQLS